MKLCIVFFIGLFGLVLSSPASSNNPETEQIAAVLEAAAAEAKAAAAAEKAEAAAPEQDSESKAASLSSASVASAGSSAKAASASASAQVSGQKKGKSGYGGYGTSNGYAGNSGTGYGSSGSVQTVLNFYPQQNGTGYGYNGNYTSNYTTSPPDNTTTQSYQKPVNYVIYIQPQAVYGQNKPNPYGQPQNAYVQNTGYGSVQNTGYGQNQYAQPSQYGNQGGYSGVNSAQLGYGIQANYLQAPPSQTYGGSSIVSGGYPVANAYGSSYNQRPPTYGSSYGGNPGYGAPVPSAYPAGNPGYAVPVAAPVAYPQPALAVAGYPTVQVPVSSYHGSASSYARPQKPQSIYVSTYTQPQIYVKPGKPAYGSKPTSYLSASASTGHATGYGKGGAQVALQATYSKPQPQVYVAVDDEAAEFKKSKPEKKAEGQEQEAESQVEVEKATN